MTPRPPVLPSVPTPFPPYTLRLPEGDALPLICDSPHSGVLYPDDFRYALPFEKLRAGEDTDVHVLWQALPAVGATLLAAEFPRAYIDPNRDAEDIDPAMLDGAWPTPLNPGEKTRLGIGLIWRDAGQNGRQAIYDRLLSVAEVQQRIAAYHAPYHAEMRKQIESAYARFGAVWHLNLHSMPANAYEGLGIKTHRPLADFVLGDRDGTTAAPEFTALVAEALRRRGYTRRDQRPVQGRRADRPARPPGRAPPQPADRGPPRPLPRRDDARTQRRLHRAAGRARRRRAGHRCLCEGTSQMSLIAEIEQAHVALTAIRRDIHAHPELAFHENRTADLVAERLAEWGLEVHRGLGKTGVVGVLRGTKGSGPAQDRPARRHGRAADARAQPLRARLDATRAACTAVATTATPRCCSARRSTWRGSAISTASSTSSSSRPRRAATPARRR